MGGQTNRRRFLGWTAAIAAAAAGCAEIGDDGGDGSDGSGGDGSDGGSTPTATATASPTPTETTETPTETTETPTETTETPDPVEPRPVRGSFPMFQYDEENSGHNLNGTGPVEGVREVWTYQSKVIVEAAPAVDDGVAYGGGSTEVYSVNASDGRVRWRRDLSGILNAVPAVDDDVVYVPKSGGTYALSAEDGTTRWRYDGMSGGSTSPVFDGDTVYVGGSRGNLYALDKATGDLQWTLDSTDRPVTDPALDGSSILAGLVGERSGISSLRAYDPADGTERWRTPIQHRITAPTVREDTVFVGIQQTGGMGRVYAIATRDGDERWFVDLPRVVSSVATDGIRVYAPTNDGITAISMQGQERWSKSVGRPRGPPTVVDGVVYAATDRLYALDARTGDVRFTHSVGASLRGPPAVLGGHVFVASASGTIYGLQGLQAQ